MFTSGGNIQIIRSCSEDDKRFKGELTGKQHGCRRRGVGDLRVEAAEGVACMQFLVAASLSGCMGA